MDLGAWAKQHAPAAVAAPLPPAVSSDEQFPAMGAPLVSVAHASVRGLLRAVIGRIYMSAAVLSTCWYPTQRWSHVFSNLCVAACRQRRTLQRRRACGVRRSTPSRLPRRRRPSSSLWLGRRPHRRRRRHAQPPPSDLFAVARRLTLCSRDMPAVAWPNQIPASRSTRQHQRHQA